MRYSATQIVLLLAAAAVGCAASAASGTLPPSVAAARVGYLVLAPDVASALGLRVSDSLPELAPSLLPAPIRQVVDSLAQEQRFPSDCTRVFAAGASFAVLLNADCPADQAAKDRGWLMDDGQLLMAIDRTGRRAERRFGPYGAFYRDVVPFLRDRRGRPIS